MLCANELSSLEPLVFILIRKANINSVYPKDYLETFLHFFFDTFNAIAIACF